MNIGFIGVGNIASSVIKGLCNSTIQNVHINISPRNKERSIALSKQFNQVTRMTSNQQVLEHSQIIFVALPPNKATQILEKLEFNEGHTLVSFVPFVSYDQLLKLGAPAGNVSRAVPFPTVEKNECPILVYRPAKKVLNILEYLGTPIHIQREEQLQTLWTLTGLIAPFYDLTQKLSDWAQSYGVESSVADKYVLELFSALTCYTRKNDSFDFSELRNEATTPNGMNFQALNIISERKANEAYLSAVETILQRFKNPDQ